MNRFKFLAVVFTALVMGLGIYSCGKESKIIENENISSTVKARTNIESLFSSINFPINSEETERLVFEDSTHFFSVYSQLDELESFNLETESGETFDDFIFSYLKFNSVFKRKFFDEYADPEDRYKPFLADGIMSMLVNEHYEFQVGDYIFTYINNDYVLATPSVNLSNIQTIRALLNGSQIQTVSDIIDKIPEGSFISDATDPEVTTRKRKLCKCEIDIQITNCTTATITGNCKNLFGDSGDGTLNVGIVNDGASTQIPVIVNLGINGNFSRSITITPTTTRINANVTSGCSSGSGDDSDFVNIPFGNFCDLGNTRETGWERSVTGTEALEHIVKRYSNWHSNRIDAEVYSKRWDGTNWVNQSRSLRATVDEVRRNINCVQRSTHSNTDQCNSCVRRKARITFSHLSDPPAHCDGDVIGIFWKDVYGLQVNGIGSINFQCCIR